MNNIMVKILCLIFVIQLFVLLSLFAQDSLEFNHVTFQNDSCLLNIKDRHSVNSGPFDLGDIISIYHIPYLNDHSIIYCPKDHKWHLFGIVNPHTRFIHLTADSLTQREWSHEGEFTDQGAEIWAPHIIFHNDNYHMFYTKIGVPREIHQVRSKDLYSWSKSEQPVLALQNEFSENMKNKDPMVFWDEQKRQWVMYYSVMKDAAHWVVGYSTSKDLTQWSDMKICFDEHTEEPGVESPFVVKQGKYYYLFLSARPWPVGGEDIFKSRSPYRWKSKHKIQRINPWHAAEVVQDLDGKWYLTLASGTQCNNLRMAPLLWKDN